MKKNVSYYQNKKEFRLYVTKTFPKLIELKKEDDKEKFNELVLKIIPQIRKYIAYRIDMAIKKGHFSKGKYKADDFIDQLFIIIYDNIQEVSTEKDFYLWLFKKTNELLEDSIIEEEFDEFFFKNIDEYSKPEWDEMQEKYSTDGGGDLLLIEELDDMSYNHNDYTLKNVFIEDNEKDLVEKLDKQLDEEKINNHIAMMLYRMPPAMSTVFDLYTNQKLELEEIAQLQNRNMKEVKQLLEDAKKALKTSFSSRYSND